MGKGVEVHSSTPLVLGVVSQIFVSAHLVCTEMLSPCVCFSHLPYRVKCLDLLVFEIDGGAEPVVASNIDGYYMRCLSWNMSLPGNHPHLATFLYLYLHPPSTAVCIKKLM